MSRWDVAIVGAGPVGMTAAALLAVRDVDVLVVEKNHATSDEPKAISLDDESLRAYQWAALDDQVLQIVVPGTGTCYYDSDGKPLLHARAPVPARLGYPFKNPFAQPDLERTLLSGLTDDLKVEVRFDSELVDLVQHPDHVQLTVSGPSGEFSVDATYVLGCDGGRSAVRLLQGIGMTGRSHSDEWLVVDTTGDEHIERYAMHYGTPDRPHVIVPGLDGRCRYEFRLFDGEGTAGERPDHALIEQLLAPYRSVTPAQVERAVIYRFNAVVADEWARGRTFLLGDAAHMMPPFAGQGLNSGIRDAANLCWKLAAVLTGDLDPATLATYEEERRPHAEAVVRSSQQLGRIVMTTSKRLARARDRLISEALTRLDGRAYFEEMRFRPAQHHRTGLVAPGDRPDLVGVMLAQPRVFSMVAHRILPLDEALGAGWAVLGVGVLPLEWGEVRHVTAPLHARTLSVPLDETLPRGEQDVLADIDGRLNDELKAYRGRFVLVRPDRFVAAAWRPEDTQSVAAHVSTWVKRTHTESTDKEAEKTDGGLHDL